MYCCVSIWPAIRSTQTVPWLKSSGQEQCSASTTESVQDLTLLMHAFKMIFWVKVDNPKLNSMTSISLAMYVLLRGPLLSVRWCESGKPDYWEILQCCHPNVLGWESTFQKTPMEQISGRTFGERYDCVIEHSPKRRREEKLILKIPRGKFWST